MLYLLLFISVVAFTIFIFTRGSEAESSGNSSIPQVSSSYATDPEKGYGYPRRWTVEDVVQRDRAAAVALHDGKNHNQALIEAAACYERDRYAEAHYLFVYTYLADPTNPNVLVNFGGNLFQLAADRNSLAYFDAFVDATERGFRLDTSGQLKRMVGSTFEQNRALRSELARTIFTDDRAVVARFGPNAANCAVFDGNHHRSSEEFKRFMTGRAKNAHLQSQAKITVQVNTADGGGNASTIDLYGDPTQWPIQIKAEILNAVDDIQSQVQGATSTEIEKLAHERRVTEVHLKVEGMQIFDSKPYASFIETAIRLQKPRVVSAL